ncbi:ShlB/FhaC/HecB family hemolysin secretion/activation protein [Erythrobacter litoralis]|uniref:ShlB/FhaC/HecB family hemolysin secretion/activation protein n=1 Tax=Erythrobacter litoralis TaxID=39960 RepID=UPI002434BC66|nr:ShlB/FhaC/HecB family hemolysin secretion/activation protein [Erythrobacter litoralis]
MNSIFLMALAAPYSVAAQDALDRTDPTQAEDPETPPEELEESVYVDDVRVEKSANVVDEGRYDIGAIVLDGLIALTPADFADIIEDYSARSLTAMDLVALTDSIARRARERGYIFASAAVAPQSLSGGYLRVRVDEGVIDEIRVTGDADRAIVAQLAPLKDGHPVTLSRLERQILIADDLSGVRLRSPRYEREGDNGILIVEARRSDFSGRAELTNDGSKPIGPVRARLDLDANGLISPFDEVDLTFSTVPTEPSELLFAAGRYGIVVSPGGTELSVSGSYSETRPGAYLEDRDIFGESMRVSAKIRHPLKRSRAFSLWTHGEFELRDLRQDRFDVRARHDRIPAVRLGLYSQALMFDGSLRGGLTLAQGLDILDATQTGDPLASRDDASPDFTTLSGWFAWERGLSQSFSLALAGRGQASTTPLLITEDIGLGGNSFLRGYNFSERTGDYGAMGSIELRYDWDAPFDVLRRTQLYAFADAGAVGNLEGGRGGGSLASGGAGLRTAITRDLGFDVEIALPLTGPRYDTDDKSPRIIGAVSLAL